MGLEPGASIAAGANLLDSVRTVWVSQYASGQAAGNNTAYDVATDPQGNVIVTGVSTFPGLADDILTVKYSRDGAELWTARYNGPGNALDIPSALTVDTAGNIYVTGYAFVDGSHYDMMTIKYAPSGAQQWAARYGGPANYIDLGRDVVVDPAGNVYVTGYSYAANNFPDIVVVKYNSSGSEQWNSRYNGPADSSDVAVMIAVDTSGSVYVTGYSDGPGTKADYVTMKYSTTGQRQWVARFNGAGSDRDITSALAVDASGNVYVTGRTYNGANYDYATIKYSSGGTEVWRSFFDYGSDDQAVDLEVDQTGYVYVTGLSYQAATQGDFGTLKYSSDGTLQWSSFYGGPAGYYDYPYALSVDVSGNVTIAGYTTSSNYYYDYTVVRYNSAGVEQWARAYDGPGNQDDYARAMALDPSGNILVTGYSRGANTGNDYATVKYSPTGVQVWLARYDTPGNSVESAAAVAMDLSGNVFVVGTSANPNTTSDVVTVKFSPAGVKLWDARYNGPGSNYDSPVDVETDPAGSVYVLASSDGSGTAQDIALVKYNAGGIQQWVIRTTSAGEYYDNARDLAVDGAGNIYVLGSIYDPANGNDFVTIKYNNSGVVQWSAQYNYTAGGYDEPTALALDQTGNVYVTGYSYVGASAYDMTTVKYSPLGILQWAAHYDNGSSLDDYGYDIAVDGTGNVIVTGFSYNAGYSSSTIVTVKYNNAGAQQWATPYTHAGAGYDYADEVAADGSGAIYVTGYTQDPVTYSADIVLLKYSSAGAQQWASVYNGPVSGSDYPNSMTLDAAGNVYVAGQVTGPQRAGDFITLKYDPAGSRQWAALYSGPGAGGDYAIDIVLDLAGNPVVAGSVRGSGWRVMTVVKYTPDVEGPVFAVPGPPLPPAAGSDVAIGASISDPSGVQGATLWHRKGGDATFASVAMTRAGTSFSGVIPGASVTIRGLEWYITAIDSMGNVSRYPSSGQSVLRVTIDGAGIASPSSQPAGSEQTAYRLVSVPLEATSKIPRDILEDDLGAYDKTKWRFFEWTTAQAYAEYPGTSSMEPGRAFWLIVKDAGKTIDTGPGTSVTTSAEFQIPLAGGWTLVGNPFDFSVPAAKLRTGSPGAVVLRSYNGAWNNPATDAVSSMEPFQGYAVYSAAAATLFVNPDLTVITPLEKPETSPLAGADGMIVVRARCGQARDEDNVIVLHADASDGADALDLPEPPPVGEYVSVSFPHPEWDGRFKDYCVDARPMPASGASWTLEVRSNIGDVLQLSLEAVESLPPGVSAVLIDQALKATLDIRQGTSYAYVNTGVESARRFSIAVGTEGYVKQMVEQAGAIPEAYQLSQNFPNPFNPMTTIRYGLPVTSHITLTVYNLVGQKVALLVDDVRPAGYHSAVFDGLNLASGVYLYRMTAEAVDGSKASFSEVRKLTFLK